MPPERVETLAQFNWSLACTGKFVWPIADRGLGNRIHRIAAPTLVIWGDKDGVIAPVYADEFAKRIAGARAGENSTRRPSCRISSSRTPCSKRCPNS